MSSIDTKSDENGWSFSATEATMLDGDDQHVIRSFRYHDLTELGKVEIKKYISAFYDGERFFVACNDHEIHCIDQTGTVLWKKIIRCNRDDLIGEVIYSIDPFSNDLITCSLNDELGDLLLIEKATGHTRATWATDYGIEKIFRTKERVFAYGYYFLYLLKENGLIPFYDAHETIVALDECNSGIYLGLFGKVICLKSGTSWHEFRIPQETKTVICDLRIEGDLVVLITREVDTPLGYKLCSLDLSLTNMRTIADLSGFDWPKFGCRRNELISRDLKKFPYQHLLE